MRPPWCPGSVSRQVIPVYESRRCRSRRYRNPRLFGLPYSARAERTEVSRQTRISGRASVVTAAAVWFLCIGVADLACAQSLQDRDHPEIRLFLQATAQDGALAGGALRQIAAGWRDGYAGIVWDLARSVRPPGPQLFQFFRLVDFLQQQTGQEFGADLVAWQDWIWDQPYDPHPDYASFKGALYGEIDRRFAEFFPSGVVSLIRLDEVVWGGVAVNGIPPLDHPAWIAADEAGYLADEHVVFGLAVNGETRAYPKRILAWHEMALDRLGGIELTIVYCTLCGTVIPYESVVNGRALTFGTSGLLYRSNKLMYDRETKTLWSSLPGTPVIGPLAHREDLKLEISPRGSHDMVRVVGRTPGYLGPFTAQ